MQLRLKKTEGPKARNYFAIVENLSGYIAVGRGLEKFLKKKLEDMEEEVIVFIPSRVMFVYNVSHVAKVYYCGIPVLAICDTAARKIEKHFAELVMPRRKRNAKNRRDVVRSLASDRVF